MPYNPYLPGSYGRSHFFGQQHAPQGTIRKARQDERALARHTRETWKIGTCENASENPVAPKIVVATGHRSKPTKYPENPTPRHKDHESHKPDRTALSASLPDLGRVRETVPLMGEKPHRQVSDSYSRKKHGWYAPEARHNNDRLALNQGPRSWAKDIKMAHNHIGYGDGIIGHGDVQKTAISPDYPEWGSGPRTYPGPYGTQGLKGDRVGRFPATFVSNGKLKALSATFERGPNLSIIETFHDTDDVPVVFPREHDDVKSNRSNYDHKKNYYDYKPFRAGITQKSQMHGGGTCVKRNYIPRSNYVERDPVIHMHA